MSMCSHVFRSVLPSGDERRQQRQDKEVEDLGRVKDGRRQLVSPT